MTTTVVYPGTFDPITLGHEDVLRRAARLFDRVVVGVAEAHHKKTLFSLEQRMDLVRLSLSDTPNIEVQAFD
ncbi:MAG: adenylyltransferase/cytidyltransferase family protein, partial [Burkholderiaceae bacterium]